MTRVGEGICFATRAFLTAPPPPPPPPPPLEVEIGSEAVAFSFDDDDVNTRDFCATTGRLAIFSAAFNAAVARASASKEEEEEASDSESSETGPRRFCGRGPFFFATFEMLVEVSAGVGDKDDADADAAAEADAADADADDIASGGGDVGGDTDDATPLLTRPGEVTLKVLAPVPLAVCRFIISALIMRGREGGRGNNWLAL